MEFPEIRQLINSTEEGACPMKKLILLLLVMMLSTGVAFAAGDKNRGSKGSGSTTQDVCGPNDDCLGDPYWW